MSELIPLDKALCLPAPDIEALVQGRMIAAMPRTFIDPGWQFALYPSDDSINFLSTDQHYRPNFLPIAQTALSQLGTETVPIKAWAKCELCQMPSEAESLEALSQLTIWTPEALQETLRQRQYIFLAYLRVYQLSQLIEVPVNLISREKIGKFVSLPSSPTVSEYVPVLSDPTFAQRKDQLENLKPPLHPELEELQTAIAQLNNPAAKQLNHNIEKFLGWTSAPLIQQSDSNSSWINRITELGNRSKEDEGKSNYQAGTDFENIVRQSLEFIGFVVDEAYKGGAGGLDLFCSKPYPLAGECKAGKTIPDRTSEELDRIGKRHLKENYSMAVRLIVGPGQPTKNLKESAQISRISIINPMTLQKLVELQAKYPGSVNLIELKQHLEPGQVDYKIDEYIQKVQGEIRLRSHLVQLLKRHLENTRLEVVGVDALYGAYVWSNPPQSLRTQEMHEILIELSSPLTGYLGRDKASNGQSDRFYFLRDLPID
jgi:hypothetical protein